MSAGSGARASLRRMKRSVSRRARVRPAEYLNARRLLKSSLFDPWYYQLQTGGHASATRAAAHFLRVGVHKGMLANPLTDFLQTGLTPSEIAAGLLDGSAREWPLREPAISVTVGRGALAAKDHRGGLAGMFLEHANAGAPLTLRNHGEAQSWTSFRRHRERRAATLERLRKSRLFERDYYELQTGMRFLSNRAAQWHYLEEGEPRGLAPNRLFEPEWYRLESPPTSTHQLLAHYLRVGKTTSWTGPHFHAPTWVELHPEAAKHPGGALGHFLAHASDATPTCPRPGQDGVAVPWADLKSAVDRVTKTWAEQSRVSTSAEATVDWEALAKQNRDNELVSVLIPTYRDWNHTRDTADSVLATSGECEIEVVVLDNGSDRSVGAILAGCFAHDDRVRIVRAPRNVNFATGSNLAFAASRGAQIVFLNRDTEVLAGWLPPMLKALQDDRTAGAQPLLLYRDGSIQTAGTLFLGSHTDPVHYLSGHPVEDLPVGDVLRTPAVSAACFALRASDFSAVRGFDPVFMNGLEDADLCLRLAERRCGDFAVCLTSRVVHHQIKAPDRSANSESDRMEFFQRWDGRLPGPDPEPWARAGFSVAGYVTADDHGVSGHRTKASPLLVRQPALVTTGVAAGVPALRWAIKIAAVGGPRGDGWGDVAFANDLAMALRALGQEVVIDRFGAHARPTSDYLDDVALHLRGLKQAHAQPGEITNAMWVISHPDLVADDELSPAFDLVYSAGPEWAREASERSGREVRPMLQATNPDRFRPDGPRLSGIDTLFVGRTRGVFRPVIRDAIEAGATLAVYGDGWDAFIDPAYVKAEHLPNDEVPAAYRGARAILNDHWPDMARLGFLSNRLFDAVACGTRVVTDPVSGVSEVFGSAVQVYDGVDDLKDLLDLHSDRWPSDDDQAKTAAHIAEHHSFAARARTLLADVLDVRGVEHSLR